MFFKKKNIIEAVGGHVLSGRPKGAKNRRSPKRDAVIAWRKYHPGGTTRQCEADTGISHPTVVKYWHEIEKEGKIGN